MRTCEQCGKELKKRHKRFCCRSCQSRCNGLIQGHKLRKPVEIVCAYCNEIFITSPSRIHKAKFCNATCQARNLNRKVLTPDGLRHPSYKNGIAGYTNHRKDTCESCGSKEKLEAHHKDQDRTNNKASNIETLCMGCHDKEHRRLKEVHLMRMGQLYFPFAEGYFDKEKRGT